MSPSNDSSTMSSNKHALTAGVILGVFGLIGIAVIVFCVSRMKRRSVSRDSSLESGRNGYAFTGFSGGKSEYSSPEMNTKHSATRVTPFSFGANGDGPVYDHSPGSNMRIASRRSNGIWIFHDVDPATGSPLGVNDPAPSPTSPFTSQTSTTPATFTFEPRGYSSTRSDAGSSRAPGRKKSYDFLSQNVATFVEREQGITRSPSPVSTIGTASLPSLPTPTYGADTAPQLPSIMPLSSSRPHASGHSEDPFSP